MKRLGLLGVLVLALATAAVADEITFTFVLGPQGSVTASAAGFNAGPSTNVLVSDTSTNIIFPLDGTFNDSAGPAASFAVFPTLVVASYTAGGANSVLIVDPSNNPLVGGNMRDNGAYLTSIPNGVGDFFGTFNVTFVDPAVLALFALPPGFMPIGSVSLAFADDDLDGTTVTGAIVGGTVTIQTPVPEPTSLVLMGAGVLAIGKFLRKSRFVK